MRIFKDVLAALLEEDPSRQLPFPTVSLNSLKMIQQSCAFVTELDLGIDREQNDVNASQTPNPKPLKNANASQYIEHLDTLSRFEILRTLTLRTQTSNDIQ
jgi:hypothetical protein